MKKKNSGFTLVELLAVVVILAVVITVASGTVISIINKSKKNMARDVRESLAEAAVTYVLGNSYLSVCSDACTINSDEEFNTLVNGTNSTCIGCTKIVTVQELIENGVFEDSRGFCNINDTVAVYRYTDGKNSDYKAYVSESVCNN